MKKDFWKKITRPMKNAWAKLSLRIGRKKGPVKLYRDVKECEYEDVHKLWDMVKKNEKDKKKKKPFGEFLLRAKKYTP